MKFLASLVGTMVLCVMCLLLFGLFSRCEHEVVIDSFVFQPENNTAYSYTQRICENCNQTFTTYLFKGTPSNTGYVDVISENCEDKTFVIGEYDTITAKVSLADYDSLKTQLSCYVQEGNVDVWFIVEFKSEYEDAVSMLQEGDEVTFYGKCSDKTVHWTDCELVLN